MDIARMKKSEEPLERRREPRFDVASGAMTQANAPAADGHACLDWSCTGFRVAAQTADGRNTLPEEGAGPFAFALRIRAAIGHISVKGTGTIVRRTDDFIAGTWTLSDPSGPHAEMAAAILDAFMEAGPGAA
jgi:hypothetical protein